MAKTKKVFQRVSQVDDLGGDGFIGSLTTTYAHLKKILGPPEQVIGEDNKVDVIWIGLLAGNPNTVSVYNYKNGKNHCGNAGTASKDITDWHVGSKSPELLKKLATALGLNVETKEYSYSRYTASKATPVVSETPDNDVEDSVSQYVNDPTNAWVDTTLTIVHALNEIDEESISKYMLYHRVTDLFNNGGHHTCNEFLQRLDVNNLPITMTIYILVITSTEKARLSAYSDFHTRVRRKLDNYPGLSKYDYILADLA